jgi:hypothetical protein
LKTDNTILTLDENKDVTLNDSNAFIFTIKKTNGSDTTYTLNGNSATITDESLVEGDSVKVFYYKLCICKDIV